MTVTPHLGRERLFLPFARLEPEVTLKKRRGLRALMTRALPLDVISGLLRAATDGGRAAAARATGIFAVTADGTWRRQERDCLEPITADDLRPHAGTRASTAYAPLSLLYVVDLARMESAVRGARAFLAGADAGTIVENVHRYCARNGLAASVCGVIDRQRLAHALALNPMQRIVLAQSIGYPREWPR